MRTVNLGEPSVGPRELEAVRQVLASGWLSGAGPACRALEAELAETVGAGSALATSNCGAALHLALVTLGVTPGDEVIVADYTFPATGHAVRWVGATPVFADVRPDTWTFSLLRPWCRNERSGSSPWTYSVSRPTTTSCAP